DYGQSDIKIASALQIPGFPGVNVHTYSFGAGQHELTLAKGVCLVLGFVKADTAAPEGETGRGKAGAKNLDWLFDN
ncbi:MAG: hypothetical protein JST39_16600, partial [Bacteroidetes bacterium]|nr:hypothetical protein [Bacteroidota bacterium]